MTKQGGSFLQLILLLFVLGFIFSLFSARNSSKTDEPAPDQDTTPIAETLKQEPSPEMTAERREAIQAFVNHASEHWALTHIEVDDSQSTVFVRLTPDKYTSKANVKEIATTIAHAYTYQTSTKFAICSVFRGDSIYAVSSYTAERVRPLLKGERTWTSVNGDTCVARFDSIEDDDTVHLMQSSGKEVVIPRAKLSEEDMFFLLDHGL